MEANAIAEPELNGQEDEQANQGTVYNIRNSILNYVLLFFQGDICRVCRCEGTPERPLFHPCICTGSIKYIHQECLLQWLKYSKKEFCELCSHRFSFTPSKNYIKL